MNQAGFPASEADHVWLASSAAATGGTSHEMSGRGDEDSRAKGAAAGEGAPGANANPTREKKLKELRTAFMVVASLIATAAYQAAVNPPPNLKEKDLTRYKVFAFFNNFSFVNAVGLMMHLLLEAVVTGNALSVETTKCFMLINLLCFAVAFVVVISDNWKGTFYYLISPVYYFVFCLVIELMFKWKQKKGSVQAGAPSG